MTSAREKYANPEFALWAVTGAVLLNGGLAVFGMQGAVPWLTGLVAGMLFSELGDRLVDRLVERQEVTADA